MRRADQGSESVQFVVSLPIFLLVVFATMQLGGMELAASQLSTEITQACRQVDAGGLQRAADKEAFVKTELLGASTQLIADRLEVAGVKCAVEPHRESSPSGDVVVEDRSDRLSVSYDVSYRIPSVLSIPGMGERTVRRHVEGASVAGRVVELSWGES